MSEELELQLSQATFNLLRHVAMSAPLPVIQSLKDQLEARYQQTVEPLHPGVRFLVEATLEGDFDTLLPMLGGLLQTGSAPSLPRIEQTLEQHGALVRSASAAPGPSGSAFQGAGKAYRAYFLRQ